MQALATTAVVGGFLEFNGQQVLRGYGGLGSKVPNFKDAIDAGHVFFDGAFAYKDAPVMREAMALANRDAKQLILSSKIPGFKLDPNDFSGSTEKCFNEILQGYGVKEIDIMYLHGPDCIHKDVLDKLVQLKEEGKFKYLGLCNVNRMTLETLADAGYRIDVVQNEFNPYCWDEDVLEYCKENNIVVVGYRSFGEAKKDEIFGHATINSIAHRVNSTASAVILQWMSQHGVTSIPHSNDTNRIKENMLATFKLTREQMDQIDSIKGEGKGPTCGWAKKLNQDLFARSQAWINQLSQKN